jgi:hypothetical protein
MECKRCDELLGTFQRSVDFYTAAQRRIRGQVGDDFVQAWKELKQLRQASLNADDTLMSHRSQDHGDRATKAILR